MNDDTTRRGVVSFPREIGRFFTGGTGQTLLVDGAPGTGKTLFTLRALDVLGRDGDVLYVSTRVDSETVAETYLGQTAVSETQVLDLSQDPFDLPMDVDVPFERLGVDSLLEWLRAVAAASPRLAVAFDSWELVYRYLAARNEDAPDVETVTNQLVALARRAGIRLLLVSESDAAGSPLGYVVDGVVGLRVSEDDRGRTRRSLVLEKLRGVRIGNRLVPITLADGRFRAVTPVDLPVVQAADDDAVYEASPNTRTQFATGITDLDRILGGGYARGSVVHLNLGRDLSRDAWSVLTLPTIRNFLAREMGVVVVPPREGSPGLLQHALDAVLPDGRFDDYCRVFETYAGPTTSDRTGDDADGDAGVTDDGAGDGGASDDGAGDRATRVSGAATDGRTAERDCSQPVTGGQLTYEPYVSYAERVREDSDGPLLHVVSTDTARRAFETRLGDFANYVALHNDLAMLVTKPGTDLRDRTDRVADTHFRLERRGEAIVLYGENPLTPLLGIGVDESGAVPEITLTEMV